MKKHFKKQLKYIGSALIIAYVPIICFAQIDNRPWRLFIGRITRYSHQAMAGGYLYVLDETEKRQTPKTVIVDSVDYIIIRASAIVDSGRIPGFIPSTFGEKVRNGDRVVYFNASKKGYKIAKGTAVTFIAPLSDSGSED